MKTNIPYRKNINSFVPTNRVPAFFASLLSMSTTSRQDHEAQVRLRSSTPSKMNKMERPAENSGLNRANTNTLTRPARTKFGKPRLSARKLWRVKVNRRWVTLKWLTDGKILQKIRSSSVLSKYYNAQNPFGSFDLAHPFPQN